MKFVKSSAAFFDESDVCLLFHHGRHESAAGVRPDMTFVRCFLPLPANRDSDHGVVWTPGSLLSIE